jgi:aldose 1-epimerase
VNHILRKEVFGTLADSRRANLYTISNGRGIEAKVTNYGGIVTSIKAPDRDGKLEELVLGFDTLEEYLGAHPYYGATIGRFANRIANARFVLKGKEYRLTANEGPDHLHGGRKGFDRVLWEAETILSEEETSIRMHYLSVDGEEGYPGDLSVSVTFSVGEDDTLKIDYSATTDQSTVLNLTNHSYFNLADGGLGDILGHELQVEADSFLPINRAALPLGPIRGVAGTPFDFRKPAPIGFRIHVKDEQLLFGGGYNHTFVLRGKGQPPARVATVRDPKSGRILELFTTEPGVQLFTANFPGDMFRGRSGGFCPSRGGFCLEAQHYPDSPNHSEYPSTVLNPGEVYRQTTVYRFSIE